jgi:hypothetical protein
MNGRQPSRYVGELTEIAGADFRLETVRWRGPGIVSDLSRRASDGENEPKGYSIFGMHPVS